MLNVLSRTGFTTAALAVTLAATPALASQPLLFEWSGVDENSNPFAVAFTVADVQNGEPGYEFNDFANFIPILYINTETTGQSQVVTDVTSDAFGGTFATPSANAFDPYFFIEAEENGTDTALEILAGADTSDIGVTFGGAAINRVWATGTIDLPFSDPALASSVSDLFPAGTYAVTPHPSLVSEVVYDNSNQFFVPTFDTLTISVVPEPATLALLGLGGLALIRRRRA